MNLPFLDVLGFLIHHQDYKLTIKKVTPTLNENLKATMTSHSLLLAPV